MNELNALINETLLYHGDWWIAVTGILAGLLGVCMSAIAWRVTGKGRD